MSWGSFLAGLGTGAIVFGIVAHYIQDVERWVVIR